MMGMLGAVVVAVVAASVVGVLGQINEPDWGFQSFLDEDFTLICNDSDNGYTSQPYNVVEWELPSGRKLGDLGEDRFFLSDHNNVRNMKLTIAKVQEHDKGIYICHVYQSNRNDKRFRILRGLNIGGHKYRDAFDEYRNNLMVAGIAALVFFVPLMTIIFVYKYRYRIPKDQRSEYEGSRPAQRWEANGSRYNQGFTGEAIDTKL